MRFHKLMRWLVFGRIEALIAGAHGLLIEAMTVSRDDDIGLVEPVRLLVLDELTVASRELWIFLWALHRLPKDDPGASLEVIAGIAARHRPVVDPCGSTRDHLATLTRLARDRIVHARNAVGRAGRSKDCPIAEAFDASVAHLDAVLRVLDGNIPGIQKSYT
jgi:hypothetical protein